MPLRYTESPNMNIEAFIPKTEYMLSGVQQAQQRHDLSQQNSSLFDLPNNHHPGFIDCRTFS